MPSVYTIETRKQALKFSAAHMATFADGTIERLHGHNYRVGAALSGELDCAGMVLDIGVLKRWVRELCDELDERVLVPLDNPLVEIEEANEQVCVRYGKKRYSLPRDDCALLPLGNTTMECLARHLAGRLSERLNAEPCAERMTELRVWVSETPGQSASWTLTLGDAAPR